MGPFGRRNALLVATLSVCLALLAACEPQGSKTSSPLTPSIASTSSNNTKTASLMEMFNSLGREQQQQFIRQMSAVVVEQPKQSSSRFVQTQTVTQSLRSPIMTFGRQSPPPASKTAPVKHASAVNFNKNQTERRETTTSKQVVQSSVPEVEIAVSQAPAAPVPQKVGKTSAAKKVVSFLQVESSSKSPKINVVQQITLPPLQLPPALKTKSVKSMQARASKTSPQAGASIVIARPTQAPTKSRSVLVVSKAPTKTSVRQPPPIVKEAPSPPPFVPKLQLQARELQEEQIEQQNKIDSSLEVGTGELLPGGQLDTAGVTFGSATQSASGGYLTAPTTPTRATLPILTRHQTKSGSRKQVAQLDVQHLQQQQQPEATLAMQQQFDELTNWTAASINNKWYFVRPVDDPRAFGLTTKATVGGDEVAVIAQVKTVPMSALLQAVASADNNNNNNDQLQQQQPSKSRSARANATPAHPTTSSPIATTSRQSAPQSPEKGAASINIVADDSADTSSGELSDAAAAFNAGHEDTNDDDEHESSRRW